MARSYVFPGRDVEALNPAERQLETLYDKLDRPGHRISVADFLKSPEYAAFLDSQSGSLADQVPPGSQIISQTPFKLEYRDSDGYTHTLTRSGTDALTGQINRQTDRPPILPNRGQEAMTADIGQQVKQFLTQPAVFAQLPPEVQQQLTAIDTAEQARNKQQYEDTAGQLLARLYGNRMNRSSVGDEQAGRLAQLYGLVSQQQQADSAARRLGLQQYLTGLGEERGRTATGLYGQLAGLSNTRDIAGAGLGLDAERLAEAMRQFNKQYGLQTLGLQQQQEQLDLARSPLAKAGQIVNMIAQLTGAASGGLSAYGALKGGNKGEMTPVWGGGR